MDKKEILNRLLSSGEANTMSESQNWKDAFKAYREGTGNNLSMKCNKCFVKVLEWLKA